ncbi:hypothetical protein [Roseovarius sp. Pro17]|uniref:hypothetical protein n=1 Tax=Roseovarius sp. Pro17 TaxID=3108175 RepID=UPI002D77D89D|nr:hypothetical protein [Roseovarius sp. Pro17]
MTALPDTFMPEGPLRYQRKAPLQHVEISETGALRHTFLRCCGYASLMAAAGMWLVPVADGDTLMQLCKLALSATLAIGGVVVLSGLRSNDGPEVHIDTQTRLLTIVEKDAHGHVRSAVSHRIDALGEIILRDGLLTARCDAGQPLIALPVRDPAVEAALIAMLAGKAA